MACACKKENNEVKMAETKYATISTPTSDGKTVVKPTDQCIACAQKHFDEAWIAFNECGYEDANRRFVRGSLRAVVLHTFRDWKEIGRLARECALLVQEGKDEEAVPKMEMLGGMIDCEFYKVNPQIKERIEKEKAKHGNPDSDTFGTGEQTRQQGT